jgi:hypothetical protein
VGTGRRFKVGDTVNLNMRVSQPGTHKPMDAGQVSLISLKLAGVQQLVAPEIFTRLEEGEYQLALITDTFDPGTYDLTVKVEDGPTKVAHATDQIVLEPL